jgi:hypothetical protein
LCPTQQNCHLDHYLHHHQFLSNNGYFYGSVAIICLCVQWIQVLLNALNEDDHIMHDYYWQYKFATGFGVSHHHWQHILKLPQVKFTMCSHNW